MRIHIFTPCARCPLDRPLKLPARTDSSLSKTMGFRDDVSSDCSVGRGQRLITAGSQYALWCCNIRQSRIGKGPAESTMDSWNGKFGVTLELGKFPIMGVIVVALIISHNPQLLMVILAKRLPVIGQNVCLIFVNKDCGPQWSFLCSWKNNNLENVWLECNNIGCILS